MRIVVLELIPAITAGFTFKLNKQRISRRHKVVFLHRFRKSITESFNYLWIVRPRSVVQCQGFTAFSVRWLDWGFDSIYPKTKVFRLTLFKHFSVLGKTEPGKIQSNDFSRFSLHQVGTAGMRWIPVGYGQKYSFRISRSSETVGGQ